jgi:hypothetical protein
VFLCVAEFLICCEKRAPVRCSLKFVRKKATITAKAAVATIVIIATGDILPDAIKTIAIAITLP